MMTSPAPAVNSPGTTDTAPPMNIPPPDTAFCCLKDWLKIIVLSSISELPVPSGAPKPMWPIPPPLP